MLFRLKAVNKDTDKKFNIFDVAGFQRVFIKDTAGIDDEDIWLYNDILSKIIEKHPGRLEYITSPTLTRIEGATRFYDRVCMFICCLEMVKRHSGNICFHTLDYQLIHALRKYFQNSKVKIKINSLWLLMYEIFSWVRFGIQLSKTVCRKAVFIMLSRFYLKINRQTPYEYAFCTFYDYGYKPEEKHTDKIFEPLLQRLVSQKKETIVFNRFLDPKKFRVYLKEIAKKSWPYENTVHERFITMKDLIISTFLGLIKRPKIDEKIYFKGYDISDLVSLSIREDFWGLGWLDDRLEHRFAVNIFRVFSLDRLIYPYENHSWEKCFVLARNQLSSKTKLAGFQHTSLSYKLLQHFPGEPEKNLGFFPDVVLTVGKILKGILEDKGHYPPNLIKEGCALRHPYLFEKEPVLTPRSFSRKIAYAFSFDFSNYGTIIRFLAEIFSDSNFKVYLKFHPLHAERAGKAWSLPGNFVNSVNISWKEIFAEIDMLLYDDNSIGIEALQYNITVVNFALTGQVYNTDRLFKYPGEKFIVDSVEGFKQYLDRYYSRDPFSHFEENKIINKQYVKDFFTPITDETLNRF